MQRLTLRLAGLHFVCMLAMLAWTLLTFRPFGTSVPGVPESIGEILGFPLIYFDEIGCKFAALGCGVGGIDPWLTAAREGKIVKSGSGSV